MIWTEVRQSVIQSGIQSYLCEMATAGHLISFTFLIASQCSIVIVNRKEMQRSISELLLLSAISPTLLVTILPKVCVLLTTASGYICQDSGELATEAE